MLCWNLIHFALVTFVARTASSATVPSSSQLPILDPITSVIGSVILSSIAVPSTVVLSSTAVASTVVLSSTAVASTVVPSSTAVASTVVPSSTAVASTVVPSSTALSSTVVLSSTAATLTSTVSATPSTTPIPSFLIHPNGNTAKCLEVRGGVFANGTPVQIFDCNGTPAQNWALAPFGQTSVQLANTGFCLDAGSSPANGVGMKIWECFSNLPAQEWFYTADLRIALTNQGFCLDLTNGNLANANQVQLWKCTDFDTNQIWSTTPGGSINGTTTIITTIPASSAPTIPASTVST